MACIASSRKENSTFVLIPVVALRRSRKNFAEGFLTVSEGGGGGGGAAMVVGSRVLLLLPKGKGPHRKHARGQRRRYKAGYSRSVLRMLILNCSALRSQFFINTLSKLSCSEKAKIFLKYSAMISHSANWPKLPAQEDNLF